MNKTQLNYWLRKTPRPVVVIADDKRIEVPNNARGWKDLTATVQAMEPSKLTVLDKNGNVIRSVVLEATDDVEEKPASASPEMSDLQLFATLLSQGYEKGMQANEPIIKSAMTFVEAQSVRLLRADAEIDRLRAHVHRLNLQIAELSNAPQVGSEEGGIMGALVAGVMQSHAANGVGIVPAANGGGGKGVKS